MDQTLTNAFIAGMVAVSVAAVTAGFQYAMKVREERRLLRVSLVEADTKAAAAFGELSGVTAGRGQTEVSEAFVQALLAEGELVEQLRRAYAERLATAPTDLKLATAELVQGRLAIIHGVGEIQTDASARVLAALGMKHDILTYAARKTIEERRSYRTLPDEDELIYRLKRFEEWNCMGRWARIRHRSRRP